MTESKKEELYQLLEDLRTVLDADEELTDHGKTQVYTAIKQVQDYVL